MSLVIVLLLSGCTLGTVATKPDLNNEKINTNQSNLNSQDLEPVSGKSLDLSNQGLTALPKYVLGRTDLQALNISHNKLTGALPAEIRQLKNLKILNISDNQMTGLPAEVGQLDKLEVLDLSNNQLTGLPYELGNLKNLKILILTGNNYSAQDLEVIKKGLGGTNIVL